jgi:hypothetical protein
MTGESAGMTGREAKGGESAGVTLLSRHSRESGNPDNMKMYSDKRYDPIRRLDPRLRGDDEKGRGDDRRKAKDGGAGGTGESAGMTKREA